jgi:hypothetical protein
MAEAGGITRKVLVWDAPTRLFHWLVVALVAAAYVTWRLNWMDWHALAGDALLALIADLVTTLHTVLWQALLAAVALHLLAILVYAVAKRQNLVLPLITGRKSLPDSVPQPAIAGPARPLRQRTAPRLVRSASRASEAIAIASLCLALNLSCAGTGSAETPRISAPALLKAPLRREKSIASLVQPEVSARG